MYLEPLLKPNVTWSLFTDTCKAFMSWTVNKTPINRFRCHLKCGIHVTFEKNLVERYEACFSVVKVFCWSSVKVSSRGSALPSATFSKPCVCVWMCEKERAVWQVSFMQSVHMKNILSPLLSPSVPLRSLWYHQALLWKLLISFCIRFFKSNFIWVAPEIDLALKHLSHVGFTCFNWTWIKVKKTNKQHLDVFELGRYIMRALEETWATLLIIKLWLQSSWVTGPHVQKQRAKQSDCPEGIALTTDLLKHSGHCPAFLFGQEHDQRAC